MLLTLGAFIIVLGVLIFVHELGHFMAAKAVGIGVPRFSIGLGPASPLSFRRGETEFVVSWIPFGGYVKMASKEDPEEFEALEGGASDEQDFPPDKLFENKPLWARMLVLSAGVLMNVLFAWVVYVGLTAVYGRQEDPTTTISYVRADVLPESAARLADVPHGTKILRINGDTVEAWNDLRSIFINPGSKELRLDFDGGFPVVALPIDGYALEERQAIYTALVPKHEARIGSVNGGSAAARAGIEPGDLVIGADGDTLRDWAEMVEVVEASPERQLELTVSRAGSTITLLATPTGQTHVNTETGERREIGQLGVFRESVVRRVRMGVGASLVEGWRLVGQDAGLILFTLRGLVLGRISPKELGGPVLIGQLSGQTARLGIVPFLQFMALFSVNLAILNLLPIPVLDGGHMMFLAYEGLMGKPVNERVAFGLTMLGLSFILGLMVYVIGLDVYRFWL